MAFDEVFLRTFACGSNYIVSHEFGPNWISNLHSHYCVLLQASLFVAEVRRRLMTTDTNKGCKMIA